MKKGLIIIINYANEKEVIDYAHMLEKQSVYDKLNLVIVNNKSSDSCSVSLIDEVKKFKVPTKLYDPKDNLGYLNGALYGYREYIKSGDTKPDWIVISNTDITISDNQFFVKLLSTEYSEDIWCIAPSIFSTSTNSYQNPSYTERCSLRKVNRLIFINRYPLLSYVYSLLANYKAKFTKKVKKESQYVYCAQGSFFVLKHEFAEQIKNNNYEGFFYSEEMYIAEHLRMSNMKCFYDHRIELLHHENSVTGLLNMKNRAKYYYHSLTYMRDNFYIRF